MENNTKVTIGTIITIIALFSGFTLQWEVSKDWTTLYSDGKIIAKEKFVVESERTYFNLESFYDRNTKCPKVIEQGGRMTATRCYYPDNYYESLSRSLINTKIDFVNETDSFSTIKKTPVYMYGTSGSYAGYVTENMTFMPNTIDEKKFPNSFNVNFNPKDTRNYKLTWRIESLKNINLPDGLYTDCKYEFGNIVIDLLDECSKLYYAEIKDGTKIYFHFKNFRGEQKLNLKLVDPIWFPDDNISTIEYNYTFTNKTVNLLNWHMVNTLFNIPVYKNITYELSCSEGNVSCYNPCLNVSLGDWCIENTVEIIDHYDTEWREVNTSYYVEEEVPDERPISITGINVNNSYYEAVFTGCLSFYNNSLSVWNVPCGQHNFDKFPQCRYFEIEKGACHIIYFGDSQ